MAQNMAHRHGRRAAGGQNAAFGRGDPVIIVAPDGVLLGQGLSRYTADEASKIKGRHTSDFEAILGYSGRAVLIHRDDMVLG